MTATSGNGAPHDQSGAQGSEAQAATLWRREHGETTRHAIQDFERIEGGNVYVAGAEAATSATSSGLLSKRVQRAIFGQPISEKLAAGERLDRFRALAILSSDALSSVAYGTEASLAVLVAAGSAALRVNVGIALVIATLMFIVANSYRQTVFAYPKGGGSYTVASENLGKIWGLIAAASLIIDYILTVSVSVAAGIAAVASAFRALGPITVPLCLAAIGVIVIVNLRGVRESGTVFALPTYLFILTFGLMIAIGIARVVSSGGLTHATPPPAIGGNQTLTVMLVLTAFASGCSAMTGVEAISNSVPAFKPPQSRHAAQTLMTMIGVLITLFLGTTYLTWRLGIAPSPGGQPTVTAQIASFAYSGSLGWMFYVVQLATLLILIFAANTSFNGFPRLAAILAMDGYLPAFFVYRGERLAYNTGILVLGAVGAAIVWAFQGNVSDLINLYALGVFTSFTLSQAGMVRHWQARRDTERGWRGRLLTNAVGAVTTAIVTVVIAVAKFDRGAWVVLVLAPLLVLSFTALKHYYSRPHEFVIDAPISDHYDTAIVPIFSPQTLLPEVRLASRAASHLIVLHLVANDDEAAAFQREWDNGIAAAVSAAGATAQLEILVSPIRSIVAPVVNFIWWHRERMSPQETLAVVLPQRLRPSVWEGALHRRIARRIRRALLSGAPDGLTVPIIDAPYTLGKAR